MSLALVFILLIKQQGVLFHIDLIYMAVIMFVEPINSLCCGVRASCTLQFEYEFLTRVRVTDHCPITSNNRKTGVHVVALVSRF